MRHWAWGEHGSTQADMKPTLPLQKALHNVPLATQYHLQLELNGQVPKLIFCKI